MIENSLPFLLHAYLRCLLYTNYLRIGIKALSKFAFVYIFRSRLEINLPLVVNILIYLKPEES